jgi:hypothetical protein
MALELQKIVNGNSRFISAFNQLAVATQNERLLQYALQDAEKSRKKLAYIRQQVVSHKEHCNLFITDRLNDEEGRDYQNMPDINKPPALEPLFAPGTFFDFEGAEFILHHGQARRSLRTKLMPGLVSLHFRNYMAMDLS